jgi:hypothetical protein
MDDLSLKGYKEFCAIRDLQVKPKHLGLNGSTGDVNRLNARVKMAKSFAGIQLDGYKEVTVDAYTAMFRVFLSFTAFEVFGYLMGHQPYQFIEYYPRHPWNEASTTIRNCDPEWVFTDALMKMIGEGGNQWALQQFKDNKFSNPMNYAQAIRNAFAHGHLTAHTGGADPDKVRIMCDTLSTLLIGIMDQEFSAIVLPRYDKYLQDDIL